MSEAWLFRAAILMVLVSACMLGWSSLLIVRVYEVKQQMRGRRG